MQIDFSNIRIDTDRREIRCDGDLVALQKRAYELLIYLIEHRERAVGKDELCEVLWAGRVVSETALTRAVMKARRAIGDGSEQQRLIKTVHGVGYRFVVEPRITMSARRSDQITGEAPEKGRHHLPGGAGLAAVLGVALLSLGVLLVPWWPWAKPSADYQLAVLPVVNETGNAELDWVSLGLMDQVRSTLDRRYALRIAPSAQVLRQLEAVPEQGEADHNEALRKSLGSQEIIRAQLSLTPGDSYQLQWRSSSGDETTIHGAEPIALADHMAERLAQRFGADINRETERLVSDDPLVNRTYALASVAALQGRRAEASQLLQMVIDAEPNAVWPRIDRAVIENRRRNFDAAADILNALQGDELNAKQRMAVHNELATLAWYQHDFQAAIAQYDQALDIAKEIEDRPAMSKVLGNRGIAYRYLKDYEQARASIRDALALRERPSASLLNSAGLVELRTDHPIKAEHYLREALMLFINERDKPGEAAVRNNLGEALHAQARYADAEAQHRQALQIREELGNARAQALSLYELGRTLAAQNRDEQAVAALQQAMRLTEDDDHDTPLRKALTRLLGELSPTIEARRR